MDAMLRIGPLVVSLIVVAAVGPLAWAQSAPWLYETVKAAPRSEGMPRRSDVGVRLFMLQKAGVRTAENLIATGKRFHITRVEWSYIMDGPFIERCRELGWHFQGTMNAITYNADHAIRGPEGEPVLDHFNKPGRYMADPNNEAYRRWYLERLTEWFELGVYAIQRDEPNGLWGLGGLRRWSHEDADAFFTRLHRQAEEAADQPVCWSCNLVWNQGGRFGGKGEIITRHFDYGMSEIGVDSLQPRFLWQAAREARQRGKTIVYTGGHDLGIPKTRLAIAGCYALGLTFIVPWDQFGGVNQDRIFAEPEELADLYGFVRAVAPLLDGYEEAAAVLPDGEEGEEGEAPVRIRGGSGDIAAVVRARPDDREAPVVVHLVEWADEPAPFEVHLESERYFGGGPLRVELLTPVAYDAEAHAQAEAAAAAMIGPGERAGAQQAPAYADLRKVQPLETTARDGWTSVRVPALQPWALLRITRDR